MSDVLDLEPEVKLSTEERRALIELELRQNPQRSDREIARVVGCDHKTVGVARERLGIGTALGNSLDETPSPTQWRRTVIAGGEEFDKRFPAEKAEEAVDIAIADGKLSYATSGNGGVGDPVVDAAVDRCRGAMMRVRDEREAGANSRGEANKEMTLLRPRDEITIQHDEERGCWIIKQRRWPDEDDELRIDDDDIHEFVDVLTDHLGYGMFRP